MITGFSHVSIVVPDIEAAARKLQERYGLQVGQRMVNAAQGVRLAYIEVGATKIELMEPSRPDSPVAKFLERNPKSTIFPSGWTASIKRLARSARAACKSLGTASPRPVSGAIASPSSTRQIFWVFSLNSKRTKLQQITRECSDASHNVRFLLHCGRRPYMALFVGCRDPAIRSLSEAKRIFSARAQSVLIDPERHLTTVN